MRAKVEEFVGTIAGDGSDELPKKGQLPVGVLT
jgi:hypothetical protein